MYVAGVDIGGTNLKFGVFDENGQPVYTLLRRTARGGPEAIASQIAALLSASPTPAEMVGAGVPGSVFRPSGKINSGNLKWFGIPFGALLREKTGLPVWIDNDAEAALAAETLPGGSCFGLESAVYLTLGTGIGGALLINGRPWRGHDNAAAELGHFVTHAGGLKCACGMNGCFEMYASAGALQPAGGRVRGAHRYSTGRGRLTRTCSAVLDAYSPPEIAIGLCSLYMIFRPQAIVLGGGISAAGETLREAILKSVPNAYDFTPETIRAALRFASRGNDAGMAGAAALARMNLKP